MKKVEKPRKGLVYYYGIILIVLLLFNFMAMPYFQESQVKEVGYSKFMTMTENENIGKVEIQDNQIIFTDKSGDNIYKTGRIADDELIQRLYASGADFSAEIVKESSPVLMFLLSWILPLIIFIGFGQFMSRKMQARGGGANSMMFNMGKSNAKVYVQSSDGIKFDDVAGEDEAKEALYEIVDYLHDPQKYEDIGASGAELANIVNEAALRSVRENRRTVTQADLEEFMDILYS